METPSASLSSSHCPKPDLVRLLFAAAFSWAATVAGGATAEEAPINAKALLVTGGGWHDYVGQTEIILAALKANLPGLEVEVSAVESSQDAPEVHPAFDDEDWAAGYDLVIYNKCNSGRFTDPELVERIVAPHRAGLPAVVIHCTMHCFRPDETGKWNAFLGIESTNHERGAPVEVRFLQREHPVLAGLPETWAYEKGELYRVISEGEHVEPLAVGVSGEGVEHTVVWTNRYGEGSIFGTTIGHANETIAEENFQSLLRNGILWALGQSE
jgi:type 1 glutamine amidotransferase